jgi:hypothetical protein
LTVSSVGVFASNYKPNPAYTAVVDYFYETSTPIASEDPPPCDPTDSLLLTTQATNGTILRTPDNSSYACGEVVTLTAQPDASATFLGWGGALSGTANPVDLTINADTTVTANFALDTSPPQVSNINVTASETSAAASWQTDELSTGFVEYGLTPSYELGSVASSTLSTTHAVTLPGLSEGEVYHYRVTAEDSLGNSASGADATFTTTTSGGGTGGAGGGPTDTCEGSCGGKSPTGCWCDDQCSQFGDCCPDKADVCDGGQTDTCEGSCGGQTPAGCWCDDQCSQFGDCCPDKTDVCGAIDVWYGAYQVFGEAGISQRFINVLGNVQDPDGIASLTYSLNGAPGLPLSIGSDGRRLERSGDFNIEIPYAGLSAGVNEIAIRASDTQSNVSTETIQVEHVDTVIAPLPYSIDWSSVTEVSDVAQIVDGKWLLESDGLRVLEPGYDRLVAIGDLQWTNYEATVEITLNKALDVNTTFSPFIGLAMRWTGHFDWGGSQPVIGWHPFGCLMGYTHGPSVSKMRGWTSDGSTIGGDGASEPAVGIPYLYKMRGEPLPGGDIQYSMKMWPSGQPEPSAWSITHIEAQPTASGSLLVVVHEADVTVGDVAVVPVGN